MRMRLIWQNYSPPAFSRGESASVEGTETTEATAALTGAGVSVSPIVIHQHKAFTAFIQQGSSAGEAEPKGKTATEISRLFVWLVNK
jgi:hypothetical protein